MERVWPTGQQTNNRGELSAIICAFMVSLDIEMVSDSQYSIDFPERVDRVLADPEPKLFLNAN